MSKREYDIVLFGATGFTGGLTAEYLAAHAPPGLRWALAGRNRAKLEAVRRRLQAISPACKDLALLDADSGRPESLQSVASSARVVITTVGPYILHGEPLVAACAEAGTDYVDLTGEPEFVDLMWLRYHELAQRSGARLIHSCGFDSIPHDLGAYFTIQQLPEGVPLSVEGFVSGSGTFSAGTYHSAIHAFSRLRGYQKVRRERRAREQRPAGRSIGSLPGGIRHRDDIHAWAVPFPSIDEQVIQRSAAAIDRYGPAFRYRHYIRLKSFKQVSMLLGGAGTLMALAQWGPTRRWLLSKRKSGDGPDEARRARSRFAVKFIGSGGGRRVVTQVSGGDPGYGETSKMLAESALCLALDALPKRAGQLTTVSAMGDALLRRLQAAGIRFEVLDSVDTGAAA